MTPAAPENPLLDARDVADAIAARRTPAPEYLGAMFGEGFWTSTPGQGLARARAGTPFAPRGADATDEFGQPVGPPPVVTMSQEEWRASPHHREGLHWDEAMTPDRAAALAEIHDENAYRRWLIAQRRAGPLDSVAGFGAAMLGGAPDPVNFIPFAGPAFRAAAAARYGTVLGRALVASGEAALGNALAAPLIAASRAGFGDDVAFADILTDIAMGAAVGFAFGAGAGAWSRLRQAGPAPDMPAQTSARAAASTAAADVAAARPIDVDAATVAQIRGTVARGESGAAIAARLAAEPRSDAPRTVYRPPAADREASLLELLAQRGLRDDGGDLKAIGAESWHAQRPGRRRLVREDGIPLDQARELATELGYIGRGVSGDNQATAITDLIAAIDSELRGAKVYPAGSRAAEAQELARAASSDRAAMERAADERGIATAGLSDDALRARLIAHDEAAGAAADAAERAAVQDDMAGRFGDAERGRAAGADDFDIPFDHVFAETPDPAAARAIAAAETEAARPARSLDDKLRAAGLDPEDVAATQADLQAIAGRLTPEDRAAIAAADVEAKSLEAQAAALERAALCPF